MMPDGTDRLQAGKLSNDCREFPSHPVRCRMGWGDGLWTACLSIVSVTGANPRDAYSPSTCRPALTIRLPVEY